MFAVLLLLAVPAVSSLDIYSVRTANISFVAECPLSAKTTNSTKNETFLVEMWERDHVPGKKDDLLVQQYCNLGQECIIVGQERELFPSQFILKVHHNCTSDKTNNTACYYAGKTSNTLEVNLGEMKIPVPNVENPAKAGVTAVVDGARRGESFSDSVKDFEENNAPPVHSFEDCTLAWKRSDI